MTLPRSEHPAIVFQNLTLGYERHPAVHHITGVIEQGELLALVGPNGAGKSTLLKGIIGELKPLDGSLNLGVNRRDIAYLPQRSDIDVSFPISVFDCASLGLWRKTGIWQGFDHDRTRSVEGALAALGIADLAGRAVGSLSGGQFQRLLFARLLLQDAPLILLDEPFRAIDAATVADLMALIGRWQREGRTVIAALHDLEQVRAHFPRTLLIAREVVAWGETRKALTPDNLAKANELTGGWDETAQVCVREDAQEREHEPA